MKERQLQILQFIYSNIQSQGFPPTVREICEAVNLSSTSTVHGHLSQLEKNGYLLRNATKPRAMEITDKGLDLLGINIHGIPMIGIVTAGQPITAVEDIEDYFPVPPTLKNQSETLFMLKIRGDSMIQAGILDGDYVIVRQESTAKNGDIVIAMTDEGEATCKRFFKEKGHIRLQPENDTLEPIILPDVQILGKVISLYREHTY
ncbi:transcriptional repressor LexA [Aerococcus sp. 1KP-2016]|uniref:transcriptional repressor LexA n=1 Tax=Aerococcus sp. 1KP-2016 TaxID=1981982 RepID=UPI000B98CCDE|nr:transcriptional repressor LexA [Aerococcus sp. 1KP-2016]OYQ66752.1 repressor LexA [Aerococcus sp. 1KP-2016]